MSAVSGERNRRTRATRSGREPWARPTAGGARAIVLALVAVVGGCAAPTRVATDRTVAPSRPTPPATEPGIASSDADSGDTSASTASTIADDRDLHAARSADIVIDASTSGRPIDPRVLGTNVPAWLGAETLAADWFREAISESGVTTLRMPGGSWSNGYGWAACELRDTDGCIWTGAARPSDFAGLLLETGLDGIWTVSINETAESAAATVAFFNGSVGDEHVIGTDHLGEDWGTAGDWAELRARNGHPQPVGIELWEVGNEVFGGRPESGGADCVAYGWEDVWTCDGAEYVSGDGDHDGFLDIRAAMIEVDPSISVGAVGVADAESWSNWGNEVIAGAGSAIDFYVVHAYGFDQSPTAEGAAERADELWGDLIEESRRGLAAGTPLAITEYNLVSVESLDTEQTMTRAMNALFIADTIGQFATHGVEIANQWNIANGVAESGTDYGLVDATDGTRSPQFEAMAMWGRSGRELLDVRQAAGLDDVRVYPTRRDDSSLAIIVLHLGAAARTVTVDLTGIEPAAAVTIHSLEADDPTSTTLEAIGPTPAGSAGDELQIPLAPWSLNLIEVAADG